MEGCLVCCSKVCPFDTCWFSELFPFLEGGGGNLFLLISISRFACETCFPRHVRDLAGHCVVFLGITLNLQYPSSPCSINGYQTLRECLQTTEEITWDGQVIHLAGKGEERRGVAIPLVTSCLRNWDVLRQPWTSTNHKPLSFTMTIFLTRLIYSRSFKAIERLQGFLPEYWRSSQRRKKLRAVSCEELPWRAQV